LNNQLVIGAIAGINIGTTIYQRRAMRAAYTSGYWSGRNDETVHHPRIGSS
jgi:hypothetical protein